MIIYFILDNTGHRISWSPSFSIKFLSELFCMTGVLITRLVRMVDLLDKLFQMWQFSTLFLLPVSLLFESRAFVACCGISNATPCRWSWTDLLALALGSPGWSLSAPTDGIISEHFVFVNIFAEVLRLEMVTVPSTGHLANVAKSSNFPFLQVLLIANKGPGHFIVLRGHELFVVLSHTSLLFYLTCT